MKTIAELIKIRQSDSGQSAREIAFNAGVDWDIYQRIVGGTAPVTYKTTQPAIRKLQAYLNIPKADVDAALKTDLLEWFDSGNA